MRLFDLISIDDFSTKEARFYYILTHFHSDHLVGMTNSFPHKVWCSSHTARLMRHYYPQVSLGILRFNKWKMLGEETKVLPLDANHMLGSLSLYFENEGGVVYTGDYRLDEQYMEALKMHGIMNTRKLYLDATFNDGDLDFLTLRESQILFSEWVKRLGGDDNIYIGIHHCGMAMLLIRAGHKFSLHESVPPKLANDLKLHYPDSVVVGSRFVVCKPTKVGEHVSPVIVPCSLYFACGRNYELVRSISKDKRGHYRLCYAAHSCQLENKLLIKLLTPKNIELLGESKLKLNCK